MKLDFRIAYEKLTCAVGAVVFAYEWKENKTVRLILNSSYFL